MMKANFEPCPHKICKECLIKEYKDIYPNIDKIAVEGTNIMLLDKRKATIRVVNNAVIIDDGMNQDYLCNCITDDEEKCKSVELL